ncbi:MAG: M20/M25/M40 family metallo-hydrolase [Bacteroidales bacterium]
MKETEKYIDLLVQILAIPSLSRREETRADFLESWLRQEGFTMKRLKNNLIVTGGNDPAEATILLNSHLDTVSPGEGWDSDPFLPVKEEDKIIGLGSNDAGASVVSMIAAYRGLIEQALADSVVLVISAEEEISGKNGLSSVIRKLPGLKFAIVGEPTGMQPAIAERGLMVVDATASGISGHAARNEGENAIYKALVDIDKIRKIEFTDHSAWLKDPSMNITMIKAGRDHNVVPSKCHFVIDVRSNDRYPNERLLELLGARCNSELIARSMRLKSSFLSENHPVCKLLNDMKLSPFGSPTLSDMALLEIPAVKIGPGNSSRSHTANEYIHISELEQAIEIYGNLLEKIVKTEL